MKKIVIALLVALLIGTIIPQSIAQQGKGRVIFLCGATSQHVIDQMVPLVPKITRDNYNFIYLSYTIEGVVFLFQFYNDRLQGILIGSTTPPEEPKSYEKEKSPFATAPKGRK